MDRTMKDVLDADEPVVSPRGMVTLALAGIVGLGITYNALIAQSGRHPAPFAASWQSAEGDRAVLRPRADRAEPASSRSKTASGSVTASVPAPGEKSDAAKREAPQGNPLVRDIQSDLSAMDLYDGPVDGLDGPKTREAIASYQRGRGVQVTGEPTQALRDDIRFNREIQDAARFTGSTGNPEERRRIRLVQTGLAELGYSPGPVDGMMGEQTRQAIRDFQRDRAMPVTGEVGPELVDELGKVSGLSSLSNF